MKRTGPLLTLAAGALVAAVLLVLDLNATRAGTSAAGDHPAPVAATTSAAPTPGPTPTANRSATPAPPTGTYAGRVDGASGATVAVAVRDGTAVAYVCDGHKAEAWLQGPATTGSVTLTGRGGSLHATYADHRLHGTVTAAGRTWTFTIAAVTAPSGLYRAAAKVRQATVVGGWIVLADGTQVGVVDVAGTAAPAPALDVTTLTSVVDGTSVMASPVDGTPLPAEGE